MKRFIINVKVLLKIVHNVYKYCIFVETKKQIEIMETKEIKIGLKIEFIETGRIYEVTRISELSVWFKDVSRSPIWRELKTTFVEKFNNPQWTIIN